MALINVFARKTTENATSDVCGVGNLRFEPTAVYRWVANADTSNALSLGQAAYHKLSDAANMEKYVYQCATANLSVLAGIVVSTDGLAASTGTSPARYGWVQVLGYNASISAINLTDVTYAVGDYLKGVNAAGHMVFDTAYTATPAYARNVRIAEAFATHTTPAAAYKKGFVNCL